MEKPKRRKDPEERRAEILAAAFSLFSERGFAATRMEDVAARAGIAKGTVYLHFPDKEALFTSLVSTMASPILARLSTMTAMPVASPKALLSAFFVLIDTEVLRTDRRHMLRLLMAEGPLFPAVTEFYHRNIISVGLPLLRRLLEQAAEKGQLRSPQIIETPQLVFAPVLLSVVWGTLFERYEHLDTKAVFDTFLDTIFLPDPGETP